MKIKKIQQVLTLLIFMAALTSAGCGQNSKTEKNTEEKNAQQPKNVQTQAGAKYKVTFIELGSVRCIPCQHMQPIMKSVEEKYGDQVNVVFYDVWTPQGKPVADKYGIKSIPTQIFLNENGKEYFRHEGFFPEEELVKVLQQKGVK